MVSTGCPFQDTSYMSPLHSCHPKTTSYFSVPFWWQTHESHTRLHKGKGGKVNTLIIPFPYFTLHFTFFPSVNCTSQFSPPLKLMLVTVFEIELWMDTYLPTSCLIMTIILQILPINVRDDHENWQTTLILLWVIKPLYTLVCIYNEFVLLMTLYQSLWHMIWGNLHANTAFLEGVGKSPNACMSAPIVVHFIEKSNTWIFICGELSKSQWEVQPNMERGGRGEGGGVRIL